MYVIHVIYDMCHIRAKRQLIYVCGIWNSYSSRFVFAYVHPLKRLGINLYHLSHSFVFDEYGYIHHHSNCPGCKNAIHKEMTKNQSIWCIHNSSCDSTANFTTISNDFLFWKPNQQINSKSFDVPETREKSSG